VRGIGWGVFGYEPGYAARQWAELAPHLRSGALVPPVAEVFSLDRVADALAVVDERRVLGKVVVRP
jgi:NADPH2:quinone reductase